MVVDAAAVAAVVVPAFAVAVVVVAAAALSSWLFSSSSNNLDESFSARPPSLWLDLNTPLSPRRATLSKLRPAKR